jgi:hypothetical protein
MERAPTTATVDPLPDGDAAGHVTLETVRARVTTAPSVPESTDRDTEIDASPFDDPPVVPLDEPLPLRVPVAAIASGVAGSAAALATGEPLLGLGLAACIFVGELMWGIVTGLPFSFGDGFLGYHADLGQARGVQEDDDLHWNWR